jgi:hypothetical protein
MKSRKPKLLAAGHPDNFQTPASALDPLLPYLKKDWTIWEPACGKGNLVGSLIHDHGYTCIGTDLIAGADFLTYRPFSPFDCILTNPPFSKKHQFLARCYELGKPFALLLPATVFDSHERRRLFHERGVEIVFPNSRINFETPNHDARLRDGKKSSAWFYSIWVTWGLNLPSQLVFAGFDDRFPLGRVA